MNLIAIYARRSEKDPPAYTSRFGYRKETLPNNSPQQQLHSQENSQHLIQIIRAVPFGRRANGSATASQELLVGGGEMKMLVFLLVLLFLT